MERIFADRAAAGHKLAEALPKVDPANTVVVALPRGGVPVSEQICKAFHLPLDLVFVRKIGAPRQPEVAVGAIVDGDPPTIVVNARIADFFKLDHEEVAAMGHALMPEIARRKALYRDGRTALDLEGKTVVVVDDGVATGATLRASLKALKARGPARIILALPVAPPSVLKMLLPLADETVCLQSPDPFFAVGAAYCKFGQTSDDEVIAAMRRCAADSDTL